MFIFKILYNYLMINHNKWWSSGLSWWLCASDLSVVSAVSDICCSKWLWSGLVEVEDEYEYWLVVSWVKECGKYDMDNHL